ncbi:2-amino-4-hydroxy-6-hydroxymethyldihydropteridine diphosphokinase [Niveispirillum fermenti]|uniref:2-amino-4-hydroxy-6- hydroxymethyldihydropteridine diphosphokinase n=1 Tax=Niveispirillum fermenti TaxID=1233113 RepID=UPI0040418E7E
MASEALGTPAQICTRALARLNSGDVRVTAVSAFYETAPVPASDQPWFVNAVARVETGLSPAALLSRLHEVEKEFGRMRRQLNEARVLDLDLLDYKGMFQEGPPILPHPRMGERAFVLYPLRDVAPHWRHPVHGATVSDLIGALTPGQGIRPLAGSVPRLSGLE